MNTDRNLFVSLLKSFKLTLGSSQIDPWSIKIEQGFNQIITGLGKGSLRISNFNIGGNAHSKPLAGKVQLHEW